LKTLETLLKVATKKVEESHEDIGKLLAVMQQMDDREKLLLGKIESEYSLASAESDANLLNFAGAFTLKSHEEVADIRKARIDAEKLMLEKQEVLRKRFIEQKRYEILLERKRLALKKEHQKKQQADLDDLTVMRHHLK